MPDPTMPTTPEQCQKELVELTARYDSYDASVKSQEKTYDSAVAGRDEVARQIAELEEHLHYLSDTNEENLPTSEPGGNVDLRQDAEPPEAAREDDDPDGNIDTDPDAQPPEAPAPNDEPNTSVSNTVFPDPDDPDEDDLRI